MNISEPGVKSIDTKYRKLEEIIAVIVVWQREIDFRNFYPSMYQIL